MHLTTGTGEFAVTLERATEALALIKQQPWGASAHLDEKGAIVTPSPDTRGRTLNLFLVNAGFAPDTLSLTTQDLEQVFLRLTGNGTGGVQ